VSTASSEASAVIDEPSALRLTPPIHWANVELCWISRRVADRLARAPIRQSTRVISSTDIALEVCNMVMGNPRKDTEVAIIGGGPGGYVAAIRAADLRQERRPHRRAGPPGRCMPDRRVHPVQSPHQRRGAGGNRPGRPENGAHVSEVSMNLDALRRWSDSVVDTLTKGWTAC